MPRPDESDDLDDLGGFLDDPHRRDREPAGYDPDPDPEPEPQPAVTRSTDPASDDRPPGKHSTDEKVREPVPFTQQIGRVAIVVIAILFGIFAVVNSQSVDFSWVFGETYVRDDPAGEGQIGGVPLIVLLIGAFVVGALLGALVQWYAARVRHAREKTTKRR